MKNPINLGKLIEIPNIRSVWKHEEYDFSQWLVQEENLLLLSEALDISIIDPQTEVRSGSFEIDILATEERTNNTIIIENQLENSNHDHLGKIITYASGKDAKYIIWIVKAAREEHRSAIDWLNTNTNENINFFLIEIKVFKIGNSEPAPKFEILSKPNDWSKIVKNFANQSELNDSQQLRLEFWNAYLSYINKPNRKPSKDNWLGLYGYGSGMHINFTSSNVGKVAMIELEFKKKEYCNILESNESTISEKFNNFSFFGFENEESKKGLRI
jgi:hypothetical protein